MRSRAAAPSFERVESTSLELPPPLAQARRIGWVRYADFQDLRAGRTAEVAARVVCRARRARVLLVAAGCLLLVPDAVSVALSLRPPSPSGVVMLVYLLAGGFPALGRMIRELEELAETGEAARP